MFKIFIKRPIFSAVISILIVAVGFLSLRSLPVTQFPDIVPPVVNVTATYLGANAEVLSKTIATQIERAVNGVAGMTYMSTVCTNDGFSITTVFFEVGIDPDVAAVSVQNRVIAVYDELPEEVLKAGVLVEKEVSGMLMYINIVSSDTTHNERFIYNFADINILKELKRISGVAYAENMGSREYSMRVWLNPDRLVAYGLTPQDVSNALATQSIEAAPGKVGISSGQMMQDRQYVLMYSGKYTTPGEYEKVVIKALPDGSLLFLKDLARIEFDSQEYNMSSNTDGRPSASIMVRQRPGSNASETIKAIKTMMAEMKQESFAPGMDYKITYDVSRFLDASIAVVLRTLLEAFLLVALVVYLFLQDWRSTLIPALAVPVSLIGSFFFMQIFGFSLNMLTLFALVLAIGIVVDNAIVVVEAVHVRMHKDRTNAYEATISAMGDIGYAIIAITLVMSAVFVPVGFLSGTVGIFYKQFALTLATAIVISGVNALTLTPALCAILLKNKELEGISKKSIIDRFFDKFNYHYDKFADKYLSVLKKFLSRRAITWLTLILFLILTGAVSFILPSGFIPDEDQGMIYANVVTPPGATLERTDAVLDSIQKVALSLKEVESVSTVGGYSLLTESDGATYGMGLINLSDWSDRKRSAYQIMDDLRGRVGHIKDAEIEFFFPPAIPGFGNASGFEVRLLDKTGAPIIETAEVAQQLVNDLNAHPHLSGVSTAFNVDFPQYKLKIDAQKAAQLGINMNDAMETLQAYIGSFYASNFIKYGQRYKVMVQADPKYRMKPEDVFSLYAKSDDGRMVPYSSFMSSEREYGPEQITRYNMYVSAMLNGEAAPGFSSGQALAAVKEVAKNRLPKGYGIEFAGVAREESNASGEAIWIFAICLMFVYLILSAQYESWFLPIPVVLSLPAGVFGSFLFLKLLGLDNNIYAQVALIMLIGLLGKNAILIIEMANQCRRKGMTVLESAIEGAKSRLRPILMTSLAFMIGIIPLMFATGAGAIGNRSIGTAAFGGMFIGTIAGIFLVPGLYVIFEMIGSRFKRKRIVNYSAINVVVVLLVFVLSGCGTTKSIFESKYKLPEYDNVTDSTNIASIQWQNYFTDPYLQKYINSALEHNATFAEAAERVTQARLYLLESRRAYTPDIYVGANAMGQKFGKYTMDGIGNSEASTIPIPDPYRQFDLGVGFAWEINVAGKLKNKKRAALARYKASEEALSYIKTLLVYEIASTYYELTGLDKDLAILQQSVERIAKATELTEELLKQGIETKLAYDQFLSTRLALEEQLIARQGEIKAKEHALFLLVGVSPFSIERAGFDNVINEKFPSNHGVSAQLIANRADIRQAHQNLKAAGADVAAAYSAFFPSIVIGGSGGASGFELSKLFTTGLAWDIAGGLVAPIFNKRQIRTAYQVAQSEQRIALRNYEQCALNAYIEVLTAMSDCEMLADRKKIKSEETTILGRSCEDAMDLFQLNYAGFLEVLSAQQRYIDTQLQLNDISMRYVLSQVRLYRALGGGGY